MTQWIALAAYGQWVMGSNITRVIGGVRKGILPSLLLCSKDKSVARLRKNPIQGFSKGTQTLNRRELLVCNILFTNSHNTPICECL